MGEELRPPDIEVSTLSSRASLDHVHVDHNIMNTLEHHQACVMMVILRNAACVGMGTYLRENTHVLRKLVVVFLRFFKRKKRC